jgi:hypothetical protein
MTEPARRRRFASRPSDVENRIKSSSGPAPAAVSNGAFTARLTIDVTPDLRGRIKVASFARGITVADTVRDPLLKALPDVDGGTP